LQKLFFKIKLSRILIYCFLPCSILLLTFCSDSENSTPAPQPFVKARGQELVTGNPETVIQLQGIDLTNAYYWEDRDLLMNSKDHSDADFARIAEMGFNSIRFSLSYLMFELDEAPGVYLEDGFTWLDGQIELARQSKLYLILDMHAPQGGFQPDAAERPLFKDQAIRDRFVALWKEIARRYKDEPVIAGYDLLNEPVPYDSKEEWQTLAQITIDAIRTVDSNHLIIIESIMNLHNNPGGAAFPGAAQFLVNDSNILYDFHFYHPENFLSQVDVSQSTNTYPNADIPIFPLDLVYFSETANLPEIIKNNNNWLEYTGPIEPVTAPEIISGFVFVDSYENSGKVYFDDLVVKEYDSSGAFIKIAASYDLNDTSSWTNYTDGSPADFLAETTTGHNDQKSLSITNHSGLATWSNFEKSFQITTGNQYQLIGWMKGENIPQAATVKLKIGFQKSESNIPVMSQTKPFLEDTLDTWLKFGKTNNVPMQVGEFGTSHFTIDTVGGENWLRDMFDILIAKKVHFAFWSYHDDASTLYPDQNKLPDPADAKQTTITVIKEALKK
jgi:endoglucanase